MPHLYFLLNDISKTFALITGILSIVTHILLLYTPFIYKKIKKIQALRLGSTNIQVLLNILQFALKYLSTGIDIFLTTIFCLSMVLFAVTNVAFDQWSSFLGILWCLIWSTIWFIDVIRIRAPYESKVELVINTENLSSRIEREDPRVEEISKNNLQNLRNRGNSPNIIASPISSGINLNENTSNIVQFSKTNSSQHLLNDPQYEPLNESIPLNQKYRAKKKSKLNCSLWYFKTIQLGIEHNGLKYIPLFVLAFVFTSIIIFSMERICFCLHPNELTTRLSRKFQSPSCPKNEICFTYLTLPQNPSTEMIIKFHTNSKPSSSILYYDTVPRLGIVDNYNYKVHCTWINMKEYVLEESRYVHSCDLINLTPNTTYYFLNAMIDDTTDKIIRVNSERKFTTNHDSNTEVVRFAIGGDRLSYSSISKSLVQNAIQKDISFFAIGGDIVYENGITHCYRRWDSFFKEYEEIYNYNGKMVPLLTSIGNHEALFWQFGVTPYEAVSYLIYLSHTIGDVGISRRLNHIHKLGGHTTLSVLDSGIVQSHKSQVPWIHDMWNNSNYKNTNKLVMYHAPIYPSSRSIDYKWGHSGRKYWEPLFDHYNVSVSFENHDHLFKRSKMLKSGGEIVNKGGTVYLGDGSLGVGRILGIGEIPKYLEKRDSKSHYWLVETTGEWATFDAIDINGDVFDSLRLEKHDGEWIIV